MSITTMNWALQQRLESPLQQILLYVIADSAAPDGTTRHCDPEYLVKRTRMSRATVFRKLSDLQRIGLVETFKGHGSHGEHIYELRLDLSKSIDVPLKSQRQNREEDENPEESHGETEAETGHESPGETRVKSLSETPAVAPVRPMQSHSCDRISPTFSKQDYPPNPPPGGSEPKLEQGQSSEPEHFEAFFTACLGWRTMPRDMALTAFGFLTPDEQGRARAAALLHAEECTKFKRRSKDAHKLIRERFWERYPSARLPQRAPDPVWIDEGPDIDALRVLALITDRPPPRLIHDEVKGSGLLRNTAVGADLRALSDFIGSGEMTDWLIVERDAREYNAWRHRIHEWTAIWLEPQKIWLESYDPQVHGQPPSHPDFQMRKAAYGLRVPCRWPPKKDGSLYSNEEDSDA